MHGVFGLDRRSTFFDVRVCHPNAESYKDLAHASANLSPAWKREETYVLKPSYGGGTTHVYAAGVHHHRWHGTRMSHLSQATSGYPVSQERRGLLDYNVLDKNQNLIFHSENIPPVLKGIAFNEESKSQPKRDGLWHRKRTFRTLDFDLEKRYWILHIQLLLLFNILIVVGSCWNRARF